MGQNFHRLMQQYWMDLPIEPILEQSPGLRKRFQAFQASPPPLIRGDRLTEYRCTWQSGTFLLLGVFDLLVVGSSQAQIVDWKSFRQPNSPDLLSQSWQTRLYPYLLAQTSPFRPDQISMTYWFAQGRSPQDAPVYHFPYSAQRHQTNHCEIAAHLQQLHRWLQEHDQGQSLPKVALAQGECFGATHTCAYAERCQRLPAVPFPNPGTSALDAIEAIPEVPL